MENPFDALIQKLVEIERNQKEILQLLKQRQPEEVLLTRFEARDMLKCSLPTLRNWEDSGRIKPIRKGRRVYFNKADLIKQ